jgi:myosin heavy subunit
MADDTPKIEEKIMKEFNEITHKPYKHQAVFFLNAYWPEFQRKDKKFEEFPEQVWKFWQKLLDIDKTQWEELHKKLWKTGWTEGSSLDEFFSHKYLEVLGKTLTGIAFRNEFRKIDVNFDKRMALVEFLVWEFGRNVPEMMKRPQGDNQEEIMAAQAALETVQKALADLQVKLEAQKAALEAQKEAEEKVKKAEAELKVAVDDLAKQESDYKHQVDTLNAKAHDDKAGAVSRNKAANELAQLKEKDPLPLRKAKLTQEAALRAVQVQRKAAEEATAACEAEKKRVEQAVEDAHQKLLKAQEKLDEVSRKGGGGQGSLWWIQREIDEAASFLPGGKKK